MRMSQVHFNDLARIREVHQNERVVFASGCFDLTHAGHALFFEDCKKYGDVLVVLVGIDAVVRRDKGARDVPRPILNERVRIKMVDSLKPVDYTFLDHVIPEDPHPLAYVRLVLTELRPDVYVINGDAFDIPYREAVTKTLGVELVVLQRWCPNEFEAISTTSIISRIRDHSHQSARM